MTAREYLAHLVAATLCGLISAGFAYALIEIWNRYLDTV
jgi:hypothetical protein